MKTNPIITFIVTEAKAGKFVRFDYVKEDGEVSTRTVRFGGHIPAKLERQGTPINGRGAWMTGFGGGFRSMLIKRGGKKYVRGTDIKDSKHKVFCVHGITKIHTNLVD